MTGETVTNVFVIYGCVSVVATIIMTARQPLIVAYIVTGILVGPLGLGLIVDDEAIDALGAFGILFLLFALGMEMQPRELVRQFRRSLITVAFSSAVFFVIAYAVMDLSGFTTTESVIVGVCMMFSSTIITLKLIPPSTLYRQHLGEVLISILLLQDILAVLALLVIRGFDISGVQLSIVDFAPILFMPLIVVGSFWFSRRVLRHLYARFDLHEYAFLLTIAWCLGVSQLAEFLHLPAEIGAFVAGLSIAIMPIAQKLDESLRPLRDFFLILFFFAIGAGLDTAGVFDSWDSAVRVLLPSALLITLSVVIKPYVFEFAMRRSGEKKPVAANAGVRLAQASEFSLLVVWSAVSSNLISSEVMVIMQLTVLVSFVISSTWVALKFPNPMSLKEELHRE
ncbi:MAG: cation:proton antiporter [Gammaproteobacteria bacterium]|nr:cation:proton antiporter [Pseudomonadota bacterium]MCH9662578.1 cation:proton antiporter [Gammaproteobacteria bacterium]